MIAIYQTLKSIGFKETYWQFVYRGQLGGLIKNARGTLIEFHVRFFNDGSIYAEMEIGRSVSLHLIDRRLYINHYLIRKLQGRLSREHFGYLAAATKKAKMMYPKSWSEWSTGNRFMTRGIRAKIQLLTLVADWRTLALIMAASVASSMARGPVIIPFFVAAMIVVYVLAPKRTQ